jgi:hypothetical protein
MKTVFFASIAVCAATIANGQVRSGVYQAVGASCRNVTDRYFQIGDGWVGAHEEYCEVTQVTNVSRMTAYLLDTRCASEGEDMGAVRYFIASTQTAEGPGIVVYTAAAGSGVGYAVTYKFCPGVNF